MSHVRAEGRMPIRRKSAGIVGAILLIINFFFPVASDCLYAQNSAGKLQGQSDLREKIEKEIESRKLEKKIRSKHPKGLKYMPAKEAFVKFSAGKLFLLDTNPKGVYREFHIWGAKLATNIDQKKNVRLPRNIEIGIYCR